MRRVGLVGGFTLVELMITLALAAILMSLAAPSFRESIISNRLSTTVNNFIGSINYTRSEAMRLGRSVTICKSKDGSACNDDAQWENGWLAFVDNNRSGDLESGEATLRFWPSLANGYTMRSTSNFSDSIRYTPRGSIAGTSGSFIICHDNNLVGAKAVTITELRPRIGIDTNADLIPEVDSGVDSVNVTSCTSL